MDYTTTCSPWMVGVKTLIAESSTHSTHSEARLMEDELQDCSSKTSDVDLDAVLDNKEEIAVSSVASEK